MKILHTADLHLGKKLYHYSRLEEQIEVMHEIHHIAEQEQVDAILIAGDLYDAINPSNDAIEVFFRELKKWSKNGSRPVIAIAGNHDSPDRIAAPDPLAKECGIFLVGYPNHTIPKLQLSNGVKISRSAPGFVEFILPQSIFPLRLLLTPFVNEIRLQRYLGDNEHEGLRDVLSAHWTALAEQFCDENGANVLMAHLFVCARGETPSEESEGEKPITLGTSSLIYADLIPSQIHYTALGHIHKGYSIPHPTSKVSYSGSPLAYSFNEAGQQKTVSIVEWENPLAFSSRRVPLSSGRPLLKASFEEVSKAIDWVTKNREAYTEITMKTESFLTSSELSLLKGASDRLINIIPEPKLSSSSQVELKELDLSKSVIDLFKDYFSLKTNQKINDEMIDLFKEMMVEKETL